MRDHRERLSQHVETEGPHSETEMGQLWATGHTVIQDGPLHTAEKNISTRFSEKAEKCSPHPQVEIRMIFFFNDKSQFCNSALPVDTLAYNSDLTWGTLTEQAVYIEFAKKKRKSKIWETLRFIVL